MSKDTCYAQNAQIDREDENLRSTVELGLGSKSYVPKIDVDLTPVCWIAPFISRSFLAVVLQVSGSAVASCHVAAMLLTGDDNAPATPDHHAPALPSY